MKEANRYERAIRALERSDAAREPAPHHRGANPSLAVARYSNDVAKHPARATFI